MRYDTAAVVRLALLLGAALPAGLAAQDAPAGRLYQVEVVVFAQPQGTSVERSPRGPAELIVTDGEAGLDAVDDPAASPSPRARGYAPPQAPLSLANVAARLNTGGYRLLWHQAWVQPAAGTAPADLAMLAALGQGRATPELGGTISLSQGRFLHLGMELEWRSATGLEAELRERRRIRAGTDQYFDHPHIGAIAVVKAIHAGAD